MNGAVRADRPVYPEEAIRETVVNALVHPSIVALGRMIPYRDEQTAKV